MVWVLIWFGLVVCYCGLDWGRGSASNQYMFLWVLPKESRSGEGIYYALGVENAETCYTLSIG